MSYSGYTTVGPGPSIIPNDNIDNPTTSQTLSHGLVFNGSSWVRERGNSVVNIFSLASRSGETYYYPSTITNHNARGVILNLSVTENTSNISFKINVLGDDGPSGMAIGESGSYAIGAGTRIIFVIYPGATTDIANAWGTVGHDTISNVLPREFRPAVITDSTAAASWTMAGTLLV